MRNNISFILIIIFQLFIIIYFYVGANKLNEELNIYAQKTNTLNLERDFEIYQYLQDNNLNALEKNLQLNLMFHLEPIEEDGLKKHITVEQITRLCKIYNNIYMSFSKRYDYKYHSTIKTLNNLCIKNKI